MAAGRGSFAKAVYLEDKKIKGGRADKVNGAPLNLERNIVIHRRLATAHAHIVARGRVRLLRQPGATAAAKKLDPLCNDLGNVAFVAALVVVGTRANASLNIDLPPFRQVLTAAFGLLTPHDNVVPFGSFLALAIAVVPLFRCGDGKISHRAARLGIANIGIFTKISDQNDFINGHVILHAAGAQISGAKGAANLAPAWRRVNRRIAARRDRRVDFCATRIYYYAIHFLRLREANLEKS
jgi:hypothetical protein